ncbi:carbon-nitrogen hydrolase family protein [Gordonia sp. MP11Mi]|uniref:carbon-nitrogen hydrolase family protein n=1 Tax=Gordonia sp. MP11Mi TaxID=3022769 RepID=UPI003B213384
MIHTTVIQVPAPVAPAGDRTRMVDDLVADTDVPNGGIIVIPEFALTGYDLAYDQHELAAEANDTIAYLKDLAVRTGNAVVTALPRDTGVAIEDASVVVGSDGSVAFGGKHFLWGEEARYFCPSASPGLLVPTPSAVVGVVICYEAGFPETVRRLALDGAEVIAIPAAFGHARRHIWDVLTVSRAVENGCIVAAAGLCGTNDAGARFAARSTVVDPRGERLTVLDDGPGAVAVSIERDTIRASRAEVPYLADIRRMQERISATRP